MTANRQVLFIQGGGEGTHDEWDDKRMLACTPKRSRRHGCTGCPSAITSWATTWPMSRR